MALIGTEGDENWPPVVESRPAVREYKVTIDGVETQLQLSDEDAERRGLKSADAVGAKARTAANKQAKAPVNKSPGATKREEIASKAWGAKPKRPSPRRR